MERSEQSSSVSHQASGHDRSHQHGPACGHRAIPHEGHSDYDVEGRLHHEHDGHCDDRGNC